MEYISSDTNIWIDFEIIKRIDLPFQLPYIYLIEQETLETEVLNPPDLGKRLLQLGLRPVELSTEEYGLLDDYHVKYPQLSVSDSSALAIAKTRNITLLTGDGKLRKAATAEGVNVIGTIGILDQLINGKYIDQATFKKCISDLLINNGIIGRVRLPENELKKRLI